LYALHFAIPLYATSTFLEQYIPTAYIGTLYSVSALMTLVLVIYMGKIVKKYHSYKTSMYILSLGILSTVGLAFSQNPYLISSLFFINMVCSFLFLTIINFFIEEFEDPTATGETRGIFLTLINSGILLSALFAGQILSLYSYNVLWLVSASCLVPIFFLIKHNYAHIKDAKIKNPNMLPAIKQIIKDKDIFAIFVSIMTLECFFVTMAIYAPSVLKNNLDIGIETYLSVILPFALIPFVVFPYQLGVIADKKYGEKEMLLIGLFILIIINIVFPNINDVKIFTVAAFLFLARIGAAMIESMCTIYFYKKVKAENISMISLFSSTRVLSYLVMPLISSIVLSLGLSISYIFYVLTILFAYSIYKVKDLVDTK
jgi:predicted MFS family arabinose efflux permease